MPKLSGNWIKIERGNKEQVLSDFKRVKYAIKLHPSYPFRHKHLKELQKTINMMNEKKLTEESKPKIIDKEEVIKQVLPESYSKRFTESEKKQLQQINMSLKPFKYQCKHDNKESRQESTEKKLSKNMTVTTFSIEKIYKTQMQRKGLQTSENFFRLRNTSHLASRDEIDKKKRGMLQTLSRQSERRKVKKSEILAYS